MMSNWLEIINIVSLILIVIIGYQLIAATIIGKFLHLRLHTLKMIQIAVLLIALCVHFWALLFFVIFVLVAVLAGALVWNFRRTVFILASLLHIRWLAMAMADETIYIDE